MKSITVEKKHSKWFRSFFLESTNPDGTNRSEPGTGLRRPVPRTKNCSHMQLGISALPIPFLYQPNFVARCTNARRTPSDTIELNRTETELN